MALLLLVCMLGPPDPARCEYRLTIKDVSRLHFACGICAVSEKVPMLRHAVYVFLALLSLIFGCKERQDWLSAG